MKNYLIGFIILGFHEFAFAVNHPIVNPGIYISTNSEMNCMISVVQSPDYSELYIRVYPIPDKPKIYDCHPRGTPVGFNKSLTLILSKNQAQCGQFPCYLDKESPVLWVVDQNTLSDGDPTVGGVLIIRQK